MFLKAKKINQKKDKKQEKRLWLVLGLGENGLAVVT